MGMTWQRLAVAAMISLFANGAVALHAQELRDRDRTLAASRRVAEDLRRARMHYGPFYLLSSIRLSDIGYSQEFFVPTADDHSGFNFGIEAPIRLYITPNRKMYFSVDATPQYSRFSAGNRNQWGLKSRADMQFLLNHLYVDVYAIRNNELRADTGELSSLLTRRHNELGTTGEFKYSSRTSMTFSAAARRQRFPLSGKDFQPEFPVNQLDRNEHAYRLALVHKTFPLTSLLVAAEHAGYSFPVAVHKDSHRDYAGAGFVRQTGRSELRFEGGYATLDFIRPDQKDFKGGVGSLNLDHRLTERWRLGGGLARDLNFSLFENNNYYVANRAAITTSASVTKRLSLNAGYTLVRDTYDVPTPGAKGGLIARRRDRITVPSVGWTYTTGRWLSGGFDVGYLTRTSNFPIQEVEGIRVILRLSINL